VHDAVIPKYQAKHNHNTKDLMQKQYLLKKILKLCYYAHSLRRLWYDTEIPYYHDTLHLACSRMKRRAKRARAVPQQMLEDVKIANQIVSFITVNYTNMNLLLT